MLASTNDATHSGKILRAYRLYLAGSAMSFEQGWISLHQILATRPTGNSRAGGDVGKHVGKGVGEGVASMAGAQSVYPFRRDYIYQPAEQRLTAPPTVERIIL